MESPDREDPGGTGFKFSDGPLALHDFYRTDGSGSPLYSLPDRVVLAACASLGLYGRPEGGHAPSLLDIPEWLGLGTAVVHGGARHVYCTLFPVLDAEHTTRIDLALVEALRCRTEPAAALRAVQRAELGRWRAGSGSLPLAFLAYPYVGLGAAPGRELATPPNATERPVYVPLPAARSPRQPRPATEPPVRPRPETSTVYDPFVMMSRHTHDGAVLSDRLNPRFDRNGRLLFTPYDGEPSAVVPVRMATWKKETFRVNDLSMRSETEWRLNDISLHITDARLILVGDRPDSQGRTLAGHIRYPWINSVSYRPRQSFLNDCELVVQCQQDTGPDTTDFFRLTLILPRETDSEDLARRVLRRLARHHLAHGELPAAVRPRFEALLDPPRLPPPDKGGQAPYHLPAFKSYPKGVEYLNGRPSEGTWIGPQLKPGD